MDPQSWQPRERQEKTVNRSEYTHIIPASSKIIIQDRFKITPFWINHLQAKMENYLLHVHDLNQRPFGLSGYQNLCLHVNGSRHGITLPSPHKDDWSRPSSVRWVASAVGSQLDYPSAGMSTDESHNIAQVIEHWPSRPSAWFESHDATDNFSILGSKLRFKR